MKHVKQQLPFYISGEMSGEQARQIEAHLEECLTCRKEWESLQAEQALLASIKPTVPSRKLVSATLEKIHQQARQDGLKVSWAEQLSSYFSPIFKPAYVGIAALVIMAVVAIFYQRGIFPKLQTPLALNPSAVLTPQGNRPPLVAENKNAKQPANRMIAQAGSRPVLEKQSTINSEENRGKGSPVLVQGIQPLVTPAMNSGPVAHPQAPAQLAMAPGTGAPRLAGAGTGQQPAQRGIASSKQPGAGGEKTVTPVSMTPSPIVTPIDKPFKVGINIIRPGNGEKAQFTYKLSQPSQVTIKIYTQAGHLVQTITDEFKQAGQFEDSWDGSYKEGTLAASGVYFVTFETNQYKTTRKIIIVK